MWVFLTSRIRTWLILAVVVPLVGTLIRAIRRKLEARSGQTTTVRALTKLERLAERRRRQEESDHDR